MGARGGGGRVRDGRHRAERRRPDQPGGGFADRALRGGAAEPAGGSRGEGGVAGGLGAGGGGPFGRKAAPAPTLGGGPGWGGGNWAHSFNCVAPRAPRPPPL